MLPKFIGCNSSMPESVAEAALWEVRNDAGINRVNGNSSARQRPSWNCGATYVSAELLAGRWGEKVGIGWSGRPVTPLIEAHIACCGNADIARFADADGRADGVNEALIYAVVADPGLQIGRRNCEAAAKGWLLFLCSGGVHENQDRWKREQAQHVIPSVGYDVAASIGDRT